MDVRRMPSNNVERRGGKKTRKLGLRSYTRYGTATDMDIIRSGLTLDDLERIAAKRGQSEKSVANERPLIDYENTPAYQDWALRDAYLAAPGKTNAFVPEKAGTKIKNAPVPRVIIPIQAPRPAYRFTPNGMVEFDPNAEFQEWWKNQKKDRYDPNDPFTRRPPPPKG
jgi:hypothetical protein